jgi:hypothetical protein
MGWVVIDEDDDDDDDDDDVACTLESEEMQTCSP